MRAAQGWAAAAHAALLISTLVALAVAAGGSAAVAFDGTPTLAPPHPDQAGPAGPAPGSDEEAVAVARRTLEAMGGWQAFQATRYLRFGFLVEREGERPPAWPQHLWDRTTGAYRVEGPRRLEEGAEPVRGLVLFDVDTRQGQAFVRGDDGWRPVAEPHVGGWLDWAHHRFINDTYWLLMPYKMQDPGVILEDAPDETVQGIEYEVVHLHFEADVGLTPGDRYWAFIDPETRMMHRWAYILEGQEPPRTVWRWSDWERHGEIALARTRQLLAADGTERPIRILFDPLAVLDDVDGAVFRDPDTTMPTP